MGYEGHLMREPGDTKADLVERAMGVLLEAAAEVGGDVVSGGGTGTWDVNSWVTELQAGSYCLMDTEYTPHASDFENALFVQATVISKNDRWGVLDAGLKAFGMDHGDPKVLDVGDCWFVSDEHITFGLADGGQGRRRRPRARDPGPRRSHGVPARAPPPHRRRRGDRGLGRRPPRLVSGRYRYVATRSQSDRNARARWLMACFSSGVISANVRPSPSTGDTIGS